MEIVLQFTGPKLLVMDCRPNTVKPEVFYEILLAYMKQQRKIDLLIDRAGMERVSGVVKDISPHNKILRTRVTMNDETGFNINQVIAVNGIFRDDFSEC